MTTTETEAPQPKEMDLPFNPEPADPERQEWLEKRRTGIGGSDIGAILGLSRYKGQLEVYCQKTGELPEQQTNELMFWGITNEDVVAREWARRLGKKVHRVNQTFQHPDHPWLIANIDRKVVGEQAILEVKTSHALNERRWDEDGIPLYYQAQVQHYLLVTGYTKAYLACLFGGNRLRSWELPRTPSSTPTSSSTAALLGPRREAHAAGPCRRTQREAAAPAVVPEDDGQVIDLPEDLVPVVSDIEIGQGRGGSVGHPSREPGEQAPGRHRRRSGGHAARPPHQVEHRQPVPHRFQGPAQGPPRPG